MRLSTAVPAEPSQLSGEYIQARVSPLAKSVQNPASGSQGFKYCSGPEMNGVPANLLDGIKPPLRAEKTPFPDFSWVRFGSYQIKATVKKLGRGAFGEVYLVKALSCVTGDELTCALKVMDSEKIQKGTLFDCEEYVANELENWSYVTSECSEHVVNLYDYKQNETFHFYLMEYVSGGTLRNLVKRQGALSEKEALNYFRSILEAVLAIAPIMHRDLHVENILLKEDALVLRPKLADFGQSSCETSWVGLQGWLGREELDHPELNYYPPESRSVDQGEYNTQKADIWLLGRLLFYLLTNDEAQIYTRDFVDDGSWKNMLRDRNGVPAVSEPIIELLEEMLCVEPTQRPVVEDVYARIERYI